VFFVEARGNAFEVALLLQLLQLFFQALDFLGRRFLVAFEIGALREVQPGQPLGDLRIAQSLIHFFEQLQIFVENIDETGQGRALEFGRTFTVTHDQASAARWTMTLTNSRSSLMYCCVLPFLIE